MTTPSFYGYMLSPKLDLDKVWNVIETHEALVPESSFIFNFTPTDLENDSMLVLVIDGAVTSILELQLRLNGISNPNYFFDGRKINNGVETILDRNSQNQGLLADNNQLGASSRFFTGTVKIFITKASTVNFPTYNSEIGTGTFNTLGTVFINPNFSFCNFRS